MQPPSQLPMPEPAELKPIEKEEENLMQDIESSKDLDNTLSNIWIYRNHRNDIFLIFISVNFIH